MAQNLKLVNLKVEGMDCANCAQAITKTLQKQGLKNVFVDFATGEASFEQTPLSSLPQVIESIHKIGYKVVSNEVVSKRSFFEQLNTIEGKFWITLPFTVLLMLHMISVFGFLQNPWVQLALCIPVYFIGVIHFGRSAFNSLKVWVPNMDVLVFMGSSAAFIYSLIGSISASGAHEAHQFLFYETCASIITLVLLGNLLEHRSVKKTTSAINDLVQMQPQKAKRIVKHGDHEHLNEVDIQEIKVGDVLQVNSGDKIPLDGVLTQGDAYVDESMISGEQEAVLKQSNDLLIGGTLVNSGSVRMKVTSIGDDTVLSHIIQMVKSAQRRKPAIQKLGDKISAVFVPVVLAISIITFIVSYFAFHVDATGSLMRSIAVVVISCPCAMGLATPTAVMVGIGRAAKRGVLIRGGDTLELLAKAKTVVFDKTGTITTGKFKLNKIHLKQAVSEDEVISIVYELEKYSSHPIAKSLVEQLSKKAKPVSMNHIVEEKGVGVSAEDLNGHKYSLGSARLFGLSKADEIHPLYLFKNEKQLAAFDIEDEIREGAKKMVATLKAQGVRVVMLSGDIPERCKPVADACGIEEVFASCLPVQKLEKIQQLSLEGNTIMVGDGINDAPALAAATVGVSLSGATQVAMQSAQVVLLNTSTFDVFLESLVISKLTLKTIKQNLFWAFFYNIVAIPFAAFGMLSPIIGAITMALSDVVVIGNSLLLKSRK